MSVPCFHQKKDLSLQKMELLIPNFGACVPKNGACVPDFGISKFFGATLQKADSAVRSHFAQAFLKSFGHWQKNSLFMSFSSIKKLAPQSCGAKLIGQAAAQSARLPSDFICSSGIPSHPGTPSILLANAFRTSDSGSRGCPCIP